MEFRYLFNNTLTTVHVEKSGEGYIVTVDSEDRQGRRYTVGAARLSRPGELALTVDGARRLAMVAADGPRRWVAFDAQPFVLTVPRDDALRQRARQASSGRHESLEAQMPGVVRRILTGAGDRVERGQVLLLLEAMKMEIRFSAPHAGVVERLLVSEGQAVERGQSLVELAREPV